MKRKLALTVGINDYEGTGQDLRGCVNDALDWAKVLTAEGYATQTLTDAEATKMRVVAALEELVGSARFGDRIVFTYSGHGSWVPDLDGDEADGRDEVLVLHDFRQGGLLSDDEIHAIFARRKRGVRVLVVSDSCHSGTLHRFAPLSPPAGGHDPVRPRFLPPVEFLAQAALARAAVVAAEPVGGRPRPGVALVSGCADSEYSYDAFIDGRPRGAFTAAAIRTWYSGQSLSDWHREIRTILPSDHYPQAPQLQAARHQKRWAL